MRVCFTINVLIVTSFCFDCFFFIPLSLDRHSVVAKFGNFRFLSHLRCNSLITLIINCL